ncbi:Alpha-N-acetylglucosaminidase, partial [Mucuna pruriens]
MRDLLSCYVKTTQLLVLFIIQSNTTGYIEIDRHFIKEKLDSGLIVTAHNMGIDTFNENSPPTNDPEYISTLGAAVYKGISKGDKDAVWLMQGWLFYSDSSFWKPPQMKALLHSVPLGKMIVLDLFADAKPIWKTSFQFYGTPYIWCMLHNFGGNIEMYGTLDAISSGPVDARVSENSTMVGVGMCMEGIEQNPIVYELMSEMAYRDKKVKVLEWIKSYCHRRYGKVVHQVEAAWEILYHTIYNCTDGIASAIAIVHNPIQHDRMKHVHIDRNFIKSKTKSGKINLSYVPSGSQEVNILRKPLLRAGFETNKLYIIVQNVSMNAKQFFPINLFLFSLLLPCKRISMGRLFYKDRLVIPSTSSWIHLLLKEFHATPVGGHFGAYMTYKKLAANLDDNCGMWLLALFVSNTYQAVSLVGLLQPLPIPKAIWEDISMNFITGLPRSKGFDAILVIVDCLSKYAHFLLLKHLFSTKNHGWYNSLYEMDKQRLICAVFLVNNLSNELVGCTPFKLVYGRKPPTLLHYLPVEILWLMTSKTMMKLLNSLHTTYHMAESANKYKRNVSFEEGD